MPEFIKRWLIKWGIQKMLKKLLGLVEGKKTYGTAIIGILLALASFLWGPFDVGGIEVPQMTLKEASGAIYAGALAFFLHAKKTA